MRMWPVLQSFLIIHHYYRFIRRMYHRLVIYYRKLNSQNVPLINDVLSELGGTSVFSSLDISSGY